MAVAGASIRAGEESETEGAELMFNGANTGFMPIAASLVMLASGVGSRK